MGDFEGARDMSAALTDEMQDTDAVKQHLQRSMLRKRHEPRRISSVILRRRLLPTLMTPPRSMNLPLPSLAVAMVKLRSKACSNPARPQLDEDAARLKLLEIFAALGPASAEVIAGRRNFLDVVFLSAEKKGQKPR